MSETTKTATLVPPYLSISKLNKVIEIFSTRNITEITSKELKGYGFGESDSYLAIAALKFLGLLDNEGNVNRELSKKLQLKGSPKLEALKDIVKKSYSLIFDRVPDPFSISNDELHNEFKIQYNLTPRLATTAIPAFLWLSELAELKEHSELIKKGTKTRKQRETKIKNVKEHSQGVKDNSNHPDDRSMNQAFQSFSFDSGIRLLIPILNQNVSKAILKGGLAEISEAIEAFENKYFLKADEQSDGK